MQSILKTFSKTSSIHTVLQRGYKQKLQIFEQGGRNSISGIRATIFGATGFLGQYVGASIGYLGSDILFPHCHIYSYDDEVKELKLCGNTGQSWIIKEMNFDDLKMIDRVIENSNVVVNLVGPRKSVKHRKDYEYANIEIARRIAAACQKNPGVLRFLHFSACGAAKDSPSLDFQTKYYGEEAVRAEFPNATIFRPTTVYGADDYFVKHILTQREYFYNFNVVTDDCTAKRQPVFVVDVANCVINALKLDETVGQTYEIGGPHVYTMKEIYEIMFNLIGRPPKLAYFPHNLALKLAERVKNWEYFNLDQIIKGKIDIVTSPNAKSIHDLCVQPVSFAQAVEPLLEDYKARFPHRKDELERQFNI